jgi:hypothetical protein
VENAAMRLDDLSQIAILDNYREDATLQRGFLNSVGRAITTKACPTTCTN